MMGCNEGLNTVTGQLAKRCKASPIAIEIRNQAIEDMALLCEAMANAKRVEADKYDDAFDAETASVCRAQASSMSACAEAIKSEKLKG